MSAGFSVGGNVLWGTNGAVEAYVEAMAAEAATAFGADPLTRFLHDEAEAFFMGKVVYLDAVLVDDAGRTKLLRVLDAATDRLLQDDVFTRVGVEWIAAVITILRSRIGDGQVSSRCAWCSHR